MRLRFSSTNTAATTNPRISLDDVGITDYSTVTATRSAEYLPNLAVWPNPAQGQIIV